MPEAIRITSDDYIKYLALGLSPGFISLKELAIQRIHGNNAYTFRKDKIQLRIKIQLLTAYWMTANFPVFRKFGNNLFGLGMGLSWRYPEQNTENRNLIKDYLAFTPLLEQIEIYGRATYHFLKRSTPP